MTNSEVVIQVLALAYAALAAATLAVVFYDEAEDEEGVSEELGSVVNDILEEVQAVKRVNKRNAAASIADESTATKRSKKEYDYSGARACIYRDYLGPDPNFGTQFQRIFRITPGIFYRVFHTVAEVDPFFTYRPNPVTKKGIHPKR